LYPSPLRDDGFDVADYASVHASYGTLEDFKSFLKATQAVELSVREHKNYVSIEIFGRNLFPRLANTPYVLTLDRTSFTGFTPAGLKCAADNCNPQVLRRS
jgi:Alpha amylase, catalytic domain